MTGESYGKLGPRFRDKAANAYQKIVRDYPLSARVDEAKDRLKSMEKEIPDPDPIAIARMKYEKENYVKPGMMAPFWGVFRKSPDVSLAAKSGNPAVTSLRPTIPVSIPSAETATGGATADIQVGTVGPNSALDTQPDARAGQPAAGTPGAAESKPAATPEAEPQQAEQKGKKQKKARK